MPGRKNAGKRRKGGQPGNKNAVGNKGGAPIGNQNARKTGIYSRLDPPPYGRFAPLALIADETYKYLRENGIIRRWKGW